MKEYSDIWYFSEIDKILNDCWVNLPRYRKTVLNIIMSLNQMVRLVIVISSLVIHNTILGNILNKDFAAISEDTKMRSLIEANKKDLDNMRQCPHFDVCNGWCPHERYLSIRHNTQHSSNCCGLNDLIEYIHNNLPSNYLSQT